MLLLLRTNALYLDKITSPKRKAFDNDDESI
jgi:hypothetical protein